MLYLHQIHEVAPGDEPGFERFVRDEWLPGVNAHDGCRFAWYGTSTSAARFADEAITIVAFDDMAAFERFATAERASRGHPLAPRSADTVETRLLRPIDYDPWTAARRHDSRRAGRGRGCHLHARLRAAGHGPDARSTST